MTTFRRVSGQIYNRKTIFSEFECLNAPQKYNNNNNNNKRICIAPSGRNFRGAGGRQRVSERRKKGKPGRRGKSLAWT